MQIFSDRDPDFKLVGITGPEAGADGDLAGDGSLRDSRHQEIFGTHHQLRFDIAESDPRTVVVAGSKARFGTVVLRVSKRGAVVVTVLRCVWSVDTHPTGTGTAGTPACEREHQRVERLIAQLKTLGIEPEQS